jgi:4-diphosphocytidyl-2-C-methyl-D-erythritol kinase
MPAAPPLVLACPAKVNLALSVGAPDAAHHGMHPIASWMVCLTLSDTVTLRRAERGGTTFDIGFDAAALPGAVVDWPLEKDLAYRAHALLEAHVGRPLPVRASIVKRIPAGAGLAGGSGNAAGMLVGLNRLFDLGLGIDTLTDLAGQLGSDVCFMVHGVSGRAAAMVTGFGDRIEPLDLSHPLHLVLVLPPFGCPTGAVYRAFDEMLAGQTRDVDLPRVRSLPAKAPLPQEAPFNDLAAAAMLAEPRLADLHRKLTDHFKLPFHVSGSGSTLFVVAPSAITAKALAHGITATQQVPAIATRTR